MHFINCHKLLILSPIILLILNACDQWGPNKFSESKTRPDNLKIIVVSDDVIKYGLNYILFEGEFKDNFILRRFSAISSPFLHVSAEPILAFDPRSRTVFYIWSRTIFQLSADQGNMIQSIYINKWGLSDDCYFTGEAYIREKSLLITAKDNIHGKIFLLEWKFALLPDDKNAYSVKTLYIKNADWSTIFSECKQIGDDQKINAYIQGLYKLLNCSLDYHSSFGLLVSGATSSHQILQLDSPISPIFNIKPGRFAMWDYAGGIWYIDNNKLFYKSPPFNSKEMVFKFPDYADLHVRPQITPDRKNMVVLTNFQSISTIYFFDLEKKEYYSVTYRNNRIVCFCLLPKSSTQSTFSGIGGRHSVQTCK